MIGDIHGMLTPLRALLAALATRDADARLIFVGDYVNRGRDSRGVIDLLLSLDNARFVRGNHDDVLDQVLHGNSYTGESSEQHRFTAFQWFIQHGLDATLMSYGADYAMLEHALRRPSMGVLEELASLLPAPHRAFIRELPAVIEEPDLFVAHAKWEPDSPSDAIAARAGSSDKTRHALVWGRFTRAEIDRKKRWRHRGFFGHTPVENYVSGEDSLLPIVRDDIVLLDTAAALSPTGRLTAVCADAREFIQANRQGEIFHCGGK